MRLTMNSCEEGRMNGCGGRMNGCRGENEELRINGCGRRKGGIDEQL